MRRTVSDDGLRACKSPPPIRVGSAVQRADAPDLSLLAGPSQSVPAIEAPPRVPLRETLRRLAATPARSALLWEMGARTGSDASAETPGTPVYSSRGP